MAHSRLSQLVSHVDVKNATVSPVTETDELEKRDHASTYSILEKPLGTPRHIRIVGIGAGASGLNMIRTLRKKLTHYEFLIYEKNPQVGGTWFENRYPGCKCDIPSHNYQFSWRKNPEWTSFFSPAAEIEQYLCKLCEEERFYDSIRTSHIVSQAAWNEDKGIWELGIKNLQDETELEDYCHFLLDARGILHEWNWPNIQGIQTFQGDLIHSANWPTNFSHAGKTVAVIGNGSSGIQIVAAIQPDVKQLVHFIRSPTWIAPPRIQTLMAGKTGEVMSKVELDEDGRFTTAQIHKFKKDPEFYMKFVKAVEEDVNGNFPIMIKDGDLATTARKLLVEYMTDALNGDPHLCKALIPNFPVGCRRLTPGNGYLEALQASNVRVVTDGIEKITPEGIQLVTGEIIRLDIIVCATGFDVSFRPRFPIIARGVNLQKLWGENLPKAYMSCAVPNFPNYFMFLGPGAPIGHGSVFTITEHISKYISHIILKCQTEGIKAISPSSAAVEEFYEHINAFMPRTAWAGSCRSWFKNGKVNGPVSALHPGSRIHFFHMLQHFRGEDWEYLYNNPSRNRFHYLGNGFSTIELGDSDSTWYLDSDDL